MKDLKVAVNVNVFDTNVCDPVSTFKSIVRNHDRKTQDDNVRFSPEFLTNPVIGRGDLVLVISEFEDWCLVSLVDAEEASTADQWVG